jgi:hypothetical protein
MIKPMVEASMSPWLISEKSPTAAALKLDVGTPDHCATALATSPFAVSLLRIPSVPRSV